MNTIRRRQPMDMKAIEQGNRFYVFNRAKIGGHTSIININHISESGYNSNIQLLPTWVPLDLTEHATKEELLKNRNVLQLLRQGHLEFCKEEEAHRIFEDPLALDEIDRINTSQQLSDQQKQITQDGQSPPQPGQAQGQVLPAASPGNIDMTYAGINPALVDTMLRPDDQMGDTQKYSTVRSLVENVGLTTKDLEFVLSKATTDSALAKLVSEELKRSR
jgi:hypothetical protein